MHIVGITGTVGAGKGTVVEYLEKHMGYTHFSVRQFLEETLIKEGKSLDRDHMRELADGLRKQFGPSYVIDQIYNKAVLLGKDAIIESIRCIGEIERLRRYKDFFLLGIDADRKTRYERVLLRGSSTDNITYDQFVEQENKEIFTKNPYEMNLRACLDMADAVIRNDGTTEELYMEVERVLGE